MRQSDKRVYQRKRPIMRIPIKCTRCKHTMMVHSVGLSEEFLKPENYICSFCRSINNKPAV